MTLLMWFNTRFFTNVLLFHKLTFKKAMVCKREFDILVIL